MDSGKDKDAPGGKAAEGANADNRRTSKQGDAEKAKSREDRLAEALRANLRRRKSAAKGRKAED